MDKEKLVKRLREKLGQYDSDKRGYSLIMLIASEPLLNYEDINYTLVVSAPWLDNKDWKDVISEILMDYVNRNQMEEFKSILRLTVVKSNDPFVKFINSSFRITGSILEIENTTIYGLNIYKAMIIESNNFSLHETLEKPA
ncbi:MAG: hypothetical protein ABSG94_12300 [Brevinematales bacterium]|jgi:hypothetical protein